MNNKFDALKDDDSGDHDQNEENSTQKDGEKEKTERDKSQSSSKRKAVVPGPAEHPLQYNYTFWYSRRTPGRPTSSQSYEQNIKQIGTFASNCEGGARRSTGVLAEKRAWSLSGRDCGLLGFGLSEPCQGAMGESRDGTRFTVTYTQ